MMGKKAGWKLQIGKKIFWKKVKMVKRGGSVKELNEKHEDGWILTENNDVCKWWKRYFEGSPKCTVRFKKRLHACPESDGACLCQTTPATGKEPSYKRIEPSEKRVCKGCYVYSVVTTWTLVYYQQHLGFICLVRKGLHRGSAFAIVAPPNCGNPS